MKQKSSTLKPNLKLRDAAILASAGAFHQPFWASVSDQLNAAYGVDAEGNIAHEPEGPEIEARKTRSNG